MLAWIVVSRLAPGMLVEVVVLTPGGGPSPAQAASPKATSAQQTVRASLRMGRRYSKIHMRSEQKTVVRNGFGLRGL